MSATDVAIALIGKMKRTATIALQAKPMAALLSAVRARSVSNQVRFATELKMTLVVVTRRIAIIVLEAVFCVIMAGAFRLAGFVMALTSAVITLMKWIAILAR